MIKFVNNPKDYYEEMYRNTICFERFEIKNNKFEDIIKENRPKTQFLPNITAILYQNYLTIIISILVLSLLITLYILKKKIFL